MNGRLMRWSVWFVLTAVLSYYATDAIAYTRKCDRTTPKGCPGCANGGCPSGDYCGDGPSDTDGNGTNDWFACKSTGGSIYCYTDCDSKCRTATTTVCTCDDATVCQ